MQKNKGSKNREHEDARNARPQKQITKKQIAKKLIT